MHAEFERWLLLRGLAREREHWCTFVEELTAALSPASVDAHDTPGNGRARDVPSPRSVEGMLAFIRASVDGQGARTLVGLSLGGMLALDWAAKYPHEVEGVVLINSSAGGLCPFHERLRPRAWPIVARAFLAPRVVARERAILRLTSAVFREDAQTLARMVAIQAARPVRRIDALRQLVASARFRASPRELSCPVLVLASAEDRLVDWRCSARLAAHLGARFIRHPSAGHDLPLDDPTWCVAQILEWRREHVRS